jgi:hypothetical protein
MKDEVDGKHDRPYHCRCGRMSSWDTERDDVPEVLDPEGEEDFGDVLDGMYTPDIGSRGRARIGMAGGPVTGAVAGRQ